MWPPLLERSNDTASHAHERHEPAIGRHCAHVVGVRPSRFNTTTIRNNTRDDSFLREIPWDLQRFTLEMV